MQARAWCGRHCERSRMWSVNAGTCVCRRSRTWSVDAGTCVCGRSRTWSVNAGTCVCGRSRTWSVDAAAARDSSSGGGTCLGQAVLAGGYQKPRSLGIARLVRSPNSWTYEMVQHSRWRFWKMVCNLSSERLVAGECCRPMSMLEDIINGRGLAAEDIINGCGLAAEDIVSGKSQCNSSKTELPADGHTMLCPH
eukprot:359587-Chlamydomonas_euryale.AAC.2